MKLLKLYIFKLWGYFNEGFTINDEKICSGKFGYVSLYMDIKAFTIYVDRINCFSGLFSYNLLHTFRIYYIDKYLGKNYIINYNFTDDKDKKLMSYIMPNSI
jgi:hypothetical protein